MYLYLGGETAVMENDIIGVFDLDNTTVAMSTRKFLARAQKEKRVVNVTYDLPRSFALTYGDEGERVYISQIAPATVKKRVNAL